MSKFYNARLYLCVSLLGLLIGFIHHLCFYPTIFHGDAAAMQVLATAILDEHSLLPIDFSYGNQLILFRSSPFISLALFLGIEGYDAFLVGSSFSLLFWFVLLFFVLNKFLPHDIPVVLLVCLFMVPIGYWEADYILGQQSHLANVIFGICVVAALWIYQKTSMSGWLYFGLICFFSISLEAPIRGVLIFFPLVCALFLVFKFRIFVGIFIKLFFVFLVAFLLNKYLLDSRPTYLNYFEALSFQRTQNVLGHFNNLIIETVESISSVDKLAGEKISILGLAIYSVGIFYTLSFVFYIGLQIKFSYEIVKRRCGGENVNLSTEDFLSLVGSIGLVIGLFVVAALNPDSARHIIWAISILKLRFFIAIYRYINTLPMSSWWCVAGFVSIILLPSFWLMAMYKNNLNFLSATDREKYEVIEKAAIEYNKTKIFGDGFWRLMPMNSYTSSISAGVLLVTENNKIIPYDWLSRKSWFNEPGDVLFYLSELDSGDVIKKRLDATGGREIAKVGDGSIWIGPPVWQNFDYIGFSQRWSGCGLPSTIGQAGDGCVMQKKDIAVDGHLTYGPYSHLPKGEYEMAIYYSGVASDTGNEIGSWDVVVTVEGDLIELSKGIIEGTDLVKSTIKVQFIIDDKLSSGLVEVRNFVHKQKHLVIHSLEIKRIR